MSNLFFYIKIACYLVYLAYAFYFAHVSENRLTKISYISLIVAVTVIFITVFIQNDTPIYKAYFSDNFSVQNLLISVSFAFVCLNHLRKQVGTPKFKFAFMSAKTQAAQMAQTAQTAQTSSN